MNYEKVPMYATSRSSFLEENFDLNATSNYGIIGPTLDFIQVKAKSASMPWEG